jgi:maleylpyruvate isomerase
MSETALEAAHTELRRRQGLGARYDSPSAPGGELDWARRGTAYFARKLNELSDADLDGESRVPRWSRRHIAACVGYHARMLTRVTEAARTGGAVRLFVTNSQREQEIEDGATLPASALRHLVAHADVHLNVEWRELETEQWDRLLPYRELAVARETPWMRAKQVWLRARDLRNGADPRDFPRDFLLAILTEKLGRPPERGADLTAVARSALRPERGTY